MCHWRKRVIMIFRDKNPYVRVGTIVPMRIKDSLTKKTHDNTKCGKDAKTFLVVYTSVHFLSSIKFDLLGK